MHSWTHLSRTSERERETDRQTETDRGRETQRETETEGERQRETETKRERGRLRRGEREYRKAPINKTATTTRKRERKKEEDFSPLTILFMACCERSWLQDWWGLQTTIGQDGLLSRDHGDHHFGGVVIDSAIGEEIDGNLKSD